MKDLLAPGHRRVLERLAASRALLAFDYDGVLAPLVRDPLGARMRDRTRRLLARAVGLACGGRVGALTSTPCGSPRASCRTSWGNHGYELLQARPVPNAVAARVAAWRVAIERELDGVEGWFIEDKRSTLAIHYGLSRRWRATGEAARAPRRGSRGRASSAARRC